MTFEDKLINEEDNLTPIEEKPKYIISDLISANRLKAYIRIDLLDKEAEVDYKEILSYLSEQGIVYGINEEEIKEYCKKKEYSKELVAAEGKEPIKGKDAQLIYDFDTSKENKFQEDADGTIDFRNLNNVINVKKDTVLCYIIPAKEGENGIDVFGGTINYKKGKNVSFNYGINTYVSKDGLQLLASTDGCVEMKNNKVFVESVYKVNNVDNTTGNIDFIGSVIVNGDIRSGFSVTAKGDIKVRGMVEGAFIKSDGEVVISKGMNGRGKGTICAKGNITSKYIENSSIFTEKSVFAEVLINNEVVAGESIILRGSTAAIIGGTSMAEDVIHAKTIGGKTNPETNIIINLNKYQEEQKLYALKKKTNSCLERELVKKNKEIKEIEEKIELILKSTLDNESKKKMQKQLLVMRIKLNNEVNDISKQLEEVLPKDNIVNHKIVCKGTMYSNTRISIGWMKYRVRQDINYSKVYADGNDISIVPLNPADIDL